jgi:anti-sigma factor RsiW
MKKCIEEGTLQAWFDGELDTNAAANVTAHVSACARCAEAARTLEAENSILAEGLSAEFAAAVPTERLRERIDAAVAGVQVRPVATQSWIRAVREFFPSVRVLAYASATAAILLAALLGVVYLRKNAAPPVLVNDSAAPPTPQREKDLPQQGTAPVAVKQPNVPPKRAPKSIRRSPASEEPATSLAWQERQYERAITKLNEAIKSQPPMRPSLQVEYEYNLAVIDNAIATTRDVARKNPKDPQAAQFVRAAYQSKVDLMNQIADARVLER